MIVIAITLGIHFLHLQAREYKLYTYSVTAVANPLYTLPSPSLNLQAVFFFVQYLTRPLFIVCTEKLHLLQIINVMRSWTGGNSM